MMEQKINIAELLKDCPTGMELDCAMYEDVHFDYVDGLNNIRCYIQQKFNKTSVVFHQDGTPNSHIKSKCVIFPKGKTTWEGFVPPCKFKDGDMFSNTEDDVRRRSTIQVLEYARSLDAYNQYGKVDIDKNIAWLEKQTNMKVSMKREEFKVGTYLYKLSHPEDDYLPEGGKRVFIHDGRIDGDGYGVMLGFTSEEELCKSSGFGNFCYGGDVRLATDEEIELFIKEVHYYPMSIKSY